MNTKNIKQVLKKKIIDWADTIEDEEVKNLVKRDTIVTGGCIVSMLLNEKINDFDIYFKTKSTVKKVAQYYVDKWNKTKGEICNKIGNSEVIYVLDGKDVDLWKQGNKNLTEFAPNYDYDILFGGPVSSMITNCPKDRIKIIFPSDGIIGEKNNELIEYEKVQEILNEMEKYNVKETQINTLDELDELKETNLENLNQKTEKYRPIFFTSNAISLSDKIQIVIRFYGNPQEIHDTYDFEHCCCYYDFDENLLVTPEKSLLSIINKQLFYRGSKYPLCSVIRTKKFITRGWKINAGQYLKMCFQIHELNLSDIDILEDQLIGVDTVYFLQVIDALRKMQEKDKEWHFDASYLATIVDRIF